MERTSGLRRVVRQCALGTLAVGFLTSLGVPHVASAATPAIVQYQLVPAYFNTQSTWDRMCKAMKVNPSGGRPTSTAIMNPHNGPFDDDHTALYNLDMGDCHKLKQRVIGYIYTDYGFRALSEVYTDIDAYYQLYPGIDGIFVDEMSNCDVCVLPNGMSIKVYYGRIYSKIKHKSTTKNDVVGNPGSAASTSWQIDSAVADEIVVFEGDRSAYVKWKPPAWVLAHPAAKFSHLVYATSSADRHDTCALSRTRNAGFIYVTDRTLPNPWGDLPSYWAKVAPVCV